jgi:hypothetical protein
MSNLDIFIEHGAKLVKMVDNLAIVGIVGSDLTKRELKKGVREILKRNKLRADAVDVEFTEYAVIFTKVGLTETANGSIINLH